jgi:putative membrane protein
MSRIAIAQILLAASISFTACGGGSKSSDSTTTPTAQAEQAPAPGGGTPSLSTAETGTNAPPDMNTPATADPSGATPSDRQPVSGTTTDKTGVGVEGGTTGTSPSGTASPPNSPGTAPPETTGAGTMSGTSGTSGTSGDTAATGGALTEPAIFGALSAANAHEIEISQLALEKSKNKDVKKFAKMMVDHHTKMQAEGDKAAGKLSITPEDTADVKTLKDDSRTALERLRGLDGKEFDSAWADQMVQDHEKVLTMIDNQILPAASANDDIQKLVKGARPKIESHLAQARKLSTKLGGSGASKM